jgi:luciferase family oxidoreductase group 1
MLTHYSPFKVAETFRMLETLYPGRIDLGIGRAPGSDQRTAMALRYAGEMIDHSLYPRMVSDLADFIGPGVAADHPFAGVQAMPVGPSQPALWLLGSSDQSAAVAAHFGCAFSYAQFINHTNGPAVMAAYRGAFKPSTRLSAPEGNIGVFVICADTEAEAKRLARSRDLWRIRIQRGEFLPIPSVEEADAYPYSDIERAQISRNQKRYVVGAPEQVKAALEEMAAAYGVNEIVVLSICHSAADRLRSYALLAEAFNLARAGA